MDSEKRVEQSIKGIGAAPGVSIGKAFVHVANELYVPQYTVRADDLNWRF